MVVLGKVEDVHAWWDRIARYWLRKSDKDKGTLLELAKIHARIQGVSLPPQPPWPRNFHTEGEISTYLQAVMKTMMQKKESVLEPPLKKVKVSDLSKRSPPPHGDLEPPLKKVKSGRRRRPPPPHGDHTWS